MRVRAFTSAVTSTPMRTPPTPPAVIGLGWVVLDTIALVPRYPDEDTKTEMLSVLDQVGGPVARALSVTAALGAPSAIGAVIGDDAAGAECLRMLRERGLDTQGVSVRTGVRTPRAQVWVSAQSASRTITYSPRAAIPALNDATYLYAATESAQLLHLDGRELPVALPLAARMRSLGRTVTLDAGGWRVGLEALLAHVDVLSVSERTLRRFDADPLRYARALRARHGLRAVVVTRGADGAWLIDDQTEHVPALAVEAVDTNGAGDAFSGGLAYALLTGRSILEAVRFATATAALMCTAFGDRLPSLPDVEALLARPSAPAAI